MKLVNFFPISTFKGSGASVPLIIWGSSEECHGNDKVINPSLQGRLLKLAAEKPNSNRQRRCHSGAWWKCCCPKKIQLQSAHKRKVGLRRICPTQVVEFSWNLFQIIQLLPYSHLWGSMYFQGQQSSQRSGSHTAAFQRWKLNCGTFTKKLTTPKISLTPKLEHALT